MYPLVIKKSAPVAWAVLATVVLSSCSKQSSSGSPEPPVVTDTTIAQVESPFGIMVEGIPETARMTTIRALGIKDVRTETKVAGFAGNDPYLDTLFANGYRVNLNFDYFGSETPAPFVTDLASLSNGITTILAKYKPLIATVENEETDIDHHTGPAQDYINELAAATTVFHTNGIKVTNGGLLEEPLCILTYRDYMSRGLTAQANDFAKRTMPPVIINDLPNLDNNPTLANRVAFTDTLIKAYKSMSFDYINFHWYEPVIERWEGKRYTVDTTHVNTQAIGEVMAYLTAATGKPAITTEVGEMYRSPGILTDIVSQLKNSAIPYAIWYSGDGKNKSNNAVALNNADGTLRLNGAAYVNFLQANYR